MTGSPNSPGAFPFTVKVADSSGAIASHDAAITVYAAIAATEPCSVKCSIGAGCTHCGGFGAVSKGLGPYTYKLVDGAVPKGMTLKQLALVGPFPAGSYNLSVQVADQLGGQVTVDANWFIYGPIGFAITKACTTTGFPPNCTGGGTYSGTGPFGLPKVSIVGYAQYCPSLRFCYPKPSGPPPAWRVTVKDDGAMTFYSEVACNSPSYTGYVILQLRDTAACAATSPSNKVSLLVNVSNGC